MHVHVYTDFIFSLSFSLSLLLSLPYPPFLSPPLFLSPSLSPTDELYMTSVSWVIPALMDHHGTTTADGSPNINTCRPMTYQEDGAKVIHCTAYCTSTHMYSLVMSIN